MRAHHRASRRERAGARFLAITTAVAMLASVACGGQEDPNGGNAQPPENRWDVMSWDQGQWARVAAHALDPIA